MTDEIYYSVVDHYMNQCGCLGDLWLSYTLNLKWSLFPRKAATARINETRFFVASELIDTISSQRIFPNKTFPVLLKIESIQKGQSSVCDEFEL